MDSESAKMKKQNMSIMRLFVTWNLERCQEGDQEIWMMSRPRPDETEQKLWRLRLDRESCSSLKCGFTEDSTTTQRDSIMFCRWSLWLGWWKGKCKSQLKLVRLKVRKQSSYCSQQLLFTIVESQYKARTTLN